MHTGISISSTKCDQKSKKRAPLPLRERDHPCSIVGAIASSAIDERLPRGGARARVVQVRVVHLGGALEEDRIGGIPRIERLQDRRRLVGLVFVPDIHHVTLKVGFGSEQI